MDKLVDELFVAHVTKRRLRLLNGGQQCDVLFDGPCACGAWHSRDELPHRIDRPRCSNATWARVVNDCYKSGVKIPADIEEAGTTLILNHKEW